MKLLSINVFLNKWFLSFAITVGSLLTSTVYAWPEVDHMNMCGAPTKVMQTYSGSWKGWAQYDKAVKNKGNSYYLNTNCPNIVAPTKKRVYKKSKLSKKSSRVTAKRITIKKRPKYNKKLDCERVDRLNGYGAK